MPDNTSSARVDCNAAPLDAIQNYFLNSLWLKVKCFMRSVFVWLIIGSVTVALVVTPRSTVAQLPDGSSTKLITVGYVPIIDAHRYEWTTGEGGGIKCSANARVSQLSVGWLPFETRKREITVAGDEFIITSDCKQVNMVRRARIDAGNSTGRIIDSITNASPEDLTNVEVRMAFTIPAIGLNGGYSAVYTDTGEAFVSKQPLDKLNNSGFVAVCKSKEWPWITLWVASPDSATRPTSVEWKNGGVYVNYRITIPRGKTISLLHGIYPFDVPKAMRSDPPNQKAIAAAMLPLQTEAWLRDLPLETRKTIANLSESDFDERVRRAKADGAEQSPAKAATEKRPAK